MSPPVSGSPRAGAGALTPSSPARVKIWDPVVRVFNWTLALGCIANLSVLRQVNAAHRYVGYAVPAVLWIRIVWSQVGARHARFSDCAPSLGRLASNLAALARGREPRCIGHNPAGAVMMPLLIGSGRSRRRNRLDDGPGRLLGCFLGGGPSRDHGQRDPCPCGHPCAGRPGGRLAPPREADLGHGDGPQASAGRRRCLSCAFC